MNDDNPVIRFEDGRLMAYGSPWSGKTLCYRRVVAPVRALVRLEQAPENRIGRLESLDAYASVIAASSTIRWNPVVMDRLIPTVERVAMNVPCFRLACRPDAEAVEVCRKGVEGPAPSQPAPSPCGPSKPDPLSGSFNSETAEA
jgi:hypothetical protein